jgi:hypothetical protein
MSNLKNETLVPVADEDAIGLGVGRRTLGRYIKNPPPGFPTVVRLNGRLYIPRSELEVYKAKLIAGAVATGSTGEVKAA